MRYLESRGPLFACECLTMNSRLIKISVTWRQCHTLQDSVVQDDT